MRVMVMVKATAEDFGKEFTPELRAQEERLRARMDRQRKS